MRPRTRAAPETPLPEPWSREDWRRRMRITRRRLGNAALPLLGPAFLRALSKSWKIERLSFEHFEKARACRGMIATLWHGRMLVPIKAHENMGMQVLVSPSDDGTLMKNLLTSFGFGIIRGSSNKNPARAIRKMLEGLKDGHTVVITPDGPRGPRHSVNPGPAWMARATGFPILPCGFVCDRAWYTKSWDRFTIPRFNARVALAYEEPMFVDRDASEDEIMRVTDRMQERMMAAEERGFRHLGTEPDW